MADNNAELLYANHQNLVKIPLLNKLSDNIFGKRKYRKKIKLNPIHNDIHTADFEGMIFLDDPLIANAIKADKSNVYIKNLAGTELPFEIRYTSGSKLLIYVKMTTSNREFYLYLDIESYTRTTTIAQVWSAYLWVFDLENGWNNVSDVSGNISTGDIAKSGSPNYEINKLGYPMPVFDGVDDYLRCDNAPALYSESVGVTSPFTFIAGIDRKTTTDLDMIIAQGSQNSTRNLLHWGFRSGANYFLGYYGSDLDYESPTQQGHYAAASNGSKVFHTVTQTYENNKVLYNESSETPLSSANGPYFWATNTTLYIGRFAHNDAHYFDGGIYDLRCRADETTLNNWKLIRQNVKFMSNFWIQTGWEAYT